MTPVISVQNLRKTYGALVAVQQTDFKYMIGYSSVSHMGLVMFGLACGTPYAISGAVYQMFAHGIMTALFFSSVGHFYEQTHTRVMKEYGGLVRQARERLQQVTMPFPAA